MQRTLWYCHPKLSIDSQSHSQRSKTLLTRTVRSSPKTLLELADSRREPRLCNTCAHGPWEQNMQQSVLRSRAIAEWCRLYACKQVVQSSRTVSQGTAEAKELYLPDLVVAIVAKTCICWLSPACRRATGRPRLYNMRTDECLRALAVQAVHTMPRDF